MCNCINDQCLTLSPLIILGSCINYYDYVAYSLRLSGFTFDHSKIHGTNVLNK